jgi:hypothetical protein
MVGKYVIVRTQSAGCFAGTLVERNGSEAVLTGARRLYQWAGAATLSQLATSGTSKPQDCKFPEETTHHLVLGVIEIIEVTAPARASIAEVPIWKA